MCIYIYASLCVIYLYIYNHITKKTHAIQQNRDRPANLSNTAHDMIISSTVRVQHI